MQTSMYFVNLFSFAGRWTQPAWLKRPLDR